MKLVLVGLGNTHFVLLLGELTYASSKQKLNVLEKENWDIEVIY